MYRLVLALLGVLFIGLKLTGHIDWSWWWVTCPLWAIPAVSLALITFSGLCAVIVICTETKEERALRRAAAAAQKIADELRSRRSL